MGVVGRKQGGRMKWTAVKVARMTGVVMVNPRVILLQMVRRLGMGRMVEMVVVVGCRMDHRAAMRMVSSLHNGAFSCPMVSW